METKEDILPSLVDPITYELFADPVIASDNHTYQRQSILQWWQSCEQRREQLTSPLTREVMTKVLQPNLVVRQIIADLIRQRTEEHKSSDDTAGLMLPQLPEEIASLEALSRIFAAIDPLRELLTQLAWQPPQIVVLGNENSGKSTLLERIAMMPLFPTDKKICTRMIIKISLRRGEPAAPRLEVCSVQDGTVSRSMGIAMDCAATRIEEVMNEEVRKENGGKLSGVCRGKMLVVHVQSSLAPNLDLVDLPGLVAARVPGEPEDMSQKSRELVEHYLDNCSAHSLYIVTVPANTATNQSIAMDLIQRRRLERWTIGVLTKADLVDVALDSDDEEDEVSGRFQELRSKLAQTSADIVQLNPYGYVATMNKRSKKAFSSRFDSLIFQANKEHEWFCKRGFDWRGSDTRVSCNALITRLMSMYHAYIMLTWLPATLRRLNAERAILVQRDMDLGQPRAHDTEVLDKQQLLTAAADSLRHNLDNVANDISDRLYHSSFANMEFTGVKQHSTSLAAFRERMKSIQQAHLAALPELIRKCVTLVLQQVPHALHNDTTAFRWNRFPAAISRVHEILNHELSAWSSLVQELTANMVREFYEMPWNPFVSISHQFQEGRGSVTFEFKYESLQAALTQAILGTLSERLQSFNPTGYMSDFDAFWQEQCAPTRREVVDRLKVVDRAVTRMFGILGLSESAKAPIASFLQTEDAYYHDLQPVEAQEAKAAEYTRQLENLRQLTERLQKEGAEIDDRLFNATIVAKRYRRGIDSASSASSTIPIDELLQRAMLQHGWTWDKDSLPTALRERVVTLLLAWPRKGPSVGPWDHQFEVLVPSDLLASAKEIHSRHQSSLQELQRVESALSPQITQILDLARRQRATLEQRREQHKNVLCSNLGLSGSSAGLEQPQTPRSMQPAKIELHKKGQIR